MEGKSIFRKEALDNIKNQWLGKALLISSCPSWLVAILSGLFFLIIMAGIIFGQYTRRINVDGEIISLQQAITIYAPQQGVVTRTFLQTGQRVNKGEPLYEIDVSRTTSSGNVSARGAEAINYQLTLIEQIIEKTEQNKQSSLNSLQQQLAQYRQAYKKSQELISSAGRGLQDMQKSMGNYDDYLRKGLINKEQFNNQRYLFYQQQSSWQSLNTQLIQEGLKIISLETDIATQSADFDNKAAEYALKRSELQRELAEVNASGTLIITAPEEGNIENMVYTAGQMVAAGDSLAQLMPGGRPQFLLVLWLPDSSVPYVSPGDAVNLRYDAYPFQKFGQFPGRIKSVSRIPASAKELMMYSSIAPAVNNGAGQAYYKTIIELAADSFRFRGESMNWSNGMKAQATLFLERRPLYQWILSPYYDIRRSLGGPV